MAANATRRINIDLPYEQVYPVIGMALFNIGITLNFVEPNTGIFHASRGVSFTTWGENITITPYRMPRGCCLDILSECSMPTQLVDWGKNSKNIDMFASELGKILGVMVY